MKITHCRVNHLSTPMGYEMRRTTFSWQVEDATGTHQSAARIVVSLAPDLRQPLADTGFAELDSLAAPVAVPLLPRTRYFWQVTVRSNAGEEAASEVQWFETGKRDEPWVAQWISCKREARHPVFIKRIDVHQPVTRARLYLCGLGLYEAEIDGVRVGEEYMTPYCTNYEEWVQYQTFDVTEQLRRGGELRVTVGRGWYSGRFGYFSKPGDPGLYGNDDRLIAEIRLTFDDGTEQVIATDESWQVVRASITDSSIYDGETRDDTLPPTAPETVFVVDAPRPVERYSLPVTVHERLTPVALIHTPKDELVLDMGQNLAGVFDLHVHGLKAGQRVHIQVGEVLQAGCFYNENLRTALAEYWYTSDGEDKVLRPRFTFYGFRYVKIEGMPNIRPEDFTALALYSDLPEAGALKTGHEKLDRLIRNVEWGLKGNFLDVPTDCPQRDERMGWTGDAQVFAPTACYLRDGYAFYRKYLHDMATEQKNLQGAVPDVVPGFAKGYRDTASVWGDAVTIIPWTLWCYYGDIAILEDCYDQMRDWVEHIRRVDGDHQGWKSEFHFGDWLALDHPSKKPDQCMGGTDVGYIAYVYYMHSTEIVAKTATLLGKHEDAHRYNALAKALRKSIVHDYFAPGGRCCADTQTGLLLALRHGLTPDPAVCVNRLMEKLRENDGKLQTGFVGTPFLCAELSTHGQADQAWRLMLNEAYPGWLYEVDLGATTIWERWNSLSPDGSVSSTGMNSFNHYAYGAIAEWLCGHAVGLRPTEDAPGLRNAIIKPTPHAAIGKAAFTYQSAAGRWVVAWEARDSRHLRLHVQVPFGCEAELHLPFAPEALFETQNPIFAEVLDGVCYLHAGAYEIEYETNRPMRHVWTLKNRLLDVMADQGALEILKKHVPEISGIPDSMRQNSIEALLRDPLLACYADRAMALEQALAEQR